MICAVGRVCHITPIESFKVLDLRRHECVVHTLIVFGLTEARISFIAHLVLIGLPRGFKIPNSDMKTALTPKPCDNIEVAEMWH